MIFYIVWNYKNLKENMNTYLIYCASKKKKPNRVSWRELSVTMNNTVDKLDLDISEKLHFSAFIWWRNHYSCFTQKWKRTLIESGNTEISFSRKIFNVEQSILVINVSILRKQILFFLVYDTSLVKIDEYKTVKTNNETFDRFLPKTWLF